MNSNYNVPVIPQNLRREETIVQIADALQYLSQVATDIFNRVNKRIEINTERLASIRGRIQDANTKIEKLTGEKKAIQVFSSSKYPAVHVNQKYVSVFGCDTKIQPSKTKYKYKDRCIAKDEPLEHMEYYHVKTKPPPEKYGTKGLGKIPEDVEYFTDLLLYNTGKNLYKEYTIIDPLDFSQRTREKEEIRNKDIEDAPASIVEKTSLKGADEESYFYSPDLGEVPTLEVPPDLPDLPGIADDLRYENESLFGIAPSVATLTPTEPKSLKLSSASNNIKENLETTAIVNNNEYNKTPVKEALHEIKETIQNENVNIQEKTENDENSNVKRELALKIHEEKSQTENEIPTPVIPELNNLACDNIESSNVEKETPNNKVDLPFANIDIHSSLMDAIRKAGGGKNLKATTPRQKETKQLPKSEGDLMADLHTKLSLRRKGISGTKPVENAPVDASSTLASVAKLIPPPPASSSEGEKEDTEDDEWDD